MKFTVVSVGKVKEPYLAAGVKDFLTRLRPYVNVEFIEGMEQKTPPDPTAAQIADVVEKEGQRVLSILKEGDYLVCLDSRGNSMTSEALAALVQNLVNSGRSRAIFVVGGSHGLSPQLLRQADLTLSFSPLTFPHQLAVLMLLEQLYRSFKIIKCEPYHK